jgi:type II secretory ATPase GspE/PulE/Tfp pilus assembly ATPase PilB-like protein
VSADALRIAGFEIDPASTSLLPYLFCVNNNVVILGKVDPAGGSPIRVGMANPADFQTVEILSRKFRDRRIEPIAITQADVTRALSVGYQQPRPVAPPARVDSVVHEMIGERYEIEFEDLGPGSTRVPGSRPAKDDPGVDDRAVVDLVNRVLLDAVKRGVTDIHIENFETNVNLRFKIDGLLYAVTSPLAKSNVDQVVSRLKVLSNLDIAEKRAPQDGRVLFTALRGDREMRVPFRLSILPGPFGEDVVLRALDRAQAPIDLTELGFAPETLTTYRALIQSPQGLVLVTGPTGSGKTTTLYASLKEIQTPHNKILSAEDPIEYTLPGVCQKQVSKYFGFADLARAFLRHDPDILLIGEIRDEPTADIAIKAAQTGHLILSTLHTNDSFGAIPRLQSLGLHPNLIASSLMGVMSQRLVRKVCKFCRVVYTPEKAMRDVVEALHGPREYTRGKGCGRCYHTGYSGRTAIAELLPVDQPLQWMIQAEAPEHELQRHAVAHGMRLLLLDGLSRVLRDVTTIDEIFRVVPYRQILAQMELIRERAPATPTP